VLPQKAYIINATTSSMSVLLNQGFHNLASIKLDATANNQLDVNNWEVPFVNGSNVSGSLCTGGNTLQLIGDQYSSTGSPEFGITVDSNNIPPENSWLFIWAMRRTLVITDQNGNINGIHVKGLNKEAQDMVQASPNSAG
jgi:hypothetical protein